MKNYFIRMSLNGFTLLEVMITLAIIAIIAVIAIPAYQNYTRKAHYAEIVQAAAPYKLSVTECYHILGSLKDCNSGNHGISNTPSHSNNIQSIMVNSGQIIITPHEKNGLKPEDTYILTPKVEHDTLIWERSGGGIIAGYTR